MHSEDDFLRKLLENPADDTVRLVYADWLDERDDEASKLKAQFLRMTVQLLEPNQPENSYEDRRREMQPLAALLPPEWLAVVSRLWIDYCGEKVAADAREERLLRQFAFICDQEWDEMTPTEDQTVRRCEKCKENIYYCDTITIAREHARQGHCVAIDLGIIRRDNDLAPRRLARGRFTADYLKRERERLSVDDVSIEREERKRKQNANAVESSE